MKKALESFIVISWLFMWMPYNNALASSSLNGYSIGSSRIIPDFQTFISGREINDPNEEIVIETNEPILFGYTQDNVNIKLLFTHSDSRFSLTQTTVSDNNGYWVYYFDEELKRGSYEVFMGMFDNTNTSSSSTIVQIVTFKIPDILPEAAESTNKRMLIPRPALDSLNYLTVSLIIVGVVILKIFFYLMARIIHSIEKK